MSTESQKQSKLQQQYVWMIAAIFVAMMMFFPTGLGPIGKAQADQSPTLYRAWAVGTGGQSVCGIRGDFTVGASSASGSEVFVFINLAWGYSWFQLGYTNGVKTNGQTYFYYEVPDPNNGTYIGNYMWHPATVPSAVHFEIWGEKAAIGQPWMIVHMSVQTAHDTWTWTSSYHFPILPNEGSVQVESWDWQNTISSGSASNLMYQTSLADNGKYPVWKSWTGYKIMNSHWPFIMTQAAHGAYDVSWSRDINTRLTDAFYGSDLLMGGTDRWSTVVNPNGYVGTDYLYYSPDPNSLKVMKGPINTGYSYAKRTFPAVSSGTLYAEARLRTDSSCSNGFGYFYVGGGQVTFAFEYGYFGWYGTTWNNLFKYTINTWYDVTFTINPTGGTYTITIKDLSSGLIKGTWSATLRYAAPHVLGDVQFQAGWKDIGLNERITMWVDGVIVHT